MASNAMSAEGPSNQYSAPAPQMSSQAPAGSNAAPSSQLPGHASFRRYDEKYCPIYKCADNFFLMKTTSFTSLPSMYISTHFLSSIDASVRGADCDCGGF